MIMIVERVDKNLPFLNLVTSQIWDHAIFMFITYFMRKIR